MAHNEHDRLRKDADDINNLDDLIDARSERTSHIANDIDSLERDVDIPEDIDVDEALTFPHPKHKKRVEDVDLMSTPDEDDMEDDQDDWSHQEFLPTDYAHDYSEGSSTDPRDDEDAKAQDVIHNIPPVTADEIARQRELEIMPSHFTVDEESEEEEA